MSFLSSFTLPGLPSLNALSDVQIESPLASPRNTLQQGNINLGGIQGTVVGNVPSSSVQQPNSQLDSSNDPYGLNTLNNTLQDAANKLSGALQSGATSATSSSTGGWLTDMLLSNRMVSAIIGLIFIAGGLFMFKDTREIVVTGAKQAAKLAA